MRLRPAGSIGVDQDNTGLSAAAPVRKPDPGVDMRRVMSGAASDSFKKVPAFTFQPANQAPA